MNSKLIREITKEIYLAEQLENQVKKTGINREFYVTLDYDKEIHNVFDYIMSNLIKDLGLIGSNFWVDPDNLKTDLGKISGYITNILSMILLLLYKLIKLLIINIPIIIIISIILMKCKFGIGFTGFDIINSILSATVISYLLSLAYLIMKQTIKITNDIEKSNEIKREWKEIEDRNNTRKSIHDDDLKIINKYKTILQSTNINIVDLSDEEQQKIKEDAKMAVIDNLGDIELFINGMLSINELTIREEIIVRSNRLVKRIKQKTC